MFADTEQDNRESLTALWKFCNIKNVIDISKDICVVFGGSFFKTLFEILKALNRQRSP